MLALITACVTTEINKEWIDETKQQLKLILNQTNLSYTSMLSEEAQYEKAMSLKKIEQILDIKNISDIDKLKKIKQIYVTKASQVAQNKMT